MALTSMKVAIETGLVGAIFSDLVDARIRSIGGWRGDTLAQIRRLIHEADPQITEDCKWSKHQSRGRALVVAQRHRLNGRGLQAGGQADLHAWRSAVRPEETLQRQP